MPSTDPNSSLRRILTVAVPIRFIVDTSVQMFYPYLPIFALGLGISTIQMGQLNSLRSLVGLGAPLLGALADRIGFRRVMRPALLLIAGALLLLALSDGFWLAAVAMIVLGIGLSGFVPTLIAYVSERAPDTQRSRAVGLLELGWAVAGVVGVYVVGILIDRTNWRLPLLLMAGTVLVSFVCLGLLPSVAKRDDDVPDAPLANFFDLRPNRRSAWATVIATAFIMFSAIHLLSSYGTWLFEQYALGAGQLAQVAFILGCAALASNLLISFVGDRIGALRAYRIAAIGSAVTHAAVMFLNIGLVPVVIGLFVSHFFFEFCIVNGLILTAGQLPAQRGKMMTLGAALGTVGLTISNLSGPWAYAQFGVAGLAIPSAVGFTVVALLAFTLIESPQESVDVA